MTEPGPTRNLFADLPDAGHAEQIETLLNHRGLRIERIVSLGQSSPAGFWYDQIKDEWVVLLRGQARLRLEHEGEARALGPGDAVWLPAHCRHRIDWTTPTEPTLWLGKL